MTRPTTALLFTLALLLTVGGTAKAQPQFWGRAYIQSPDPQTTPVIHVGTAYTYSGGNGSVWIKDAYYSSFVGLRLYAYNVTQSKTGSYGWTNYYLTRESSAPFDWDGSWDTSLTINASDFNDGDQVRMTLITYFWDNGVIVGKYQDGLTYTVANP